MRPIEDPRFVTSPPDGPLTIAELATWLNRSPRTVLRLLKLGLPRQKRGRLYVFDAREVARWLEKRNLLDMTPPRPMPAAG